MRLWALALLCVSWLPAADTLDFYFIDVEGGQATLIVSPSGQSLLMDAGWPGFDNRDADRIAAAAREAGIQQIDYFVASHYHTDHIGGVPQLAAKLPIRNFVDHGPSVESGERADSLFATYAAERAKGNHIVVKPGDRIPLAGVEVTVVVAGGERITKPLRGGGKANPLCASAERKRDDTGENAASVGFVVRHGRFRFADLGDLTWNKEIDLACPKNLIGPVDLYLTTHHGMDASGPPQIVHALAPRVAIMNNGAKKGGSPGAWQVIRQSPGLEDIWQLHHSIAGGAQNNAPEQFIANIEEQCRGNMIKVSASVDGSFTVSNPRVMHTKTYKKR